MKQRTPQLYAICGVVAPAFFGLMVFLEQLIVPDYNWISQHVSDLGAYSLYGVYALLQNLNFWIFGILVVVFALGLGKTLPSSKSVVATLVLFGVMVFSAGLFPDEPSPFPGGVHALVSIVAFISIILCQFLAWQRLRHSNPAEGNLWAGYSVYSLLSGLLSIIFLVGPPESIAGVVITGLKQRLFLVVPWLWIELMALKVLRLYKTQKQASVQ
jgi:hypothetical membrane protein